MRHLLPWVLAALSSIVVVLWRDLLGMAPWVAKKLVCRAARRLPAGYQERYEEEWAAEIEAMGDRAGIGPLVFALLWFWKARRMAEIASQAPTNETGRPLIQRVPLPGGIRGTAMSLFAVEGISAVGVGRIATEAEVTPTTLYHQFGGKDELVADAVELWCAHWLWMLAVQLEPYGDDAMARYAGLWDALAQRFASEDFCGSFIINAAVELRGQPNHPAHAVIAACHRTEREFLKQLALAAGAEDPVALASTLQLPVHGAIIQGSPDAARAARALALAAL